MAKIELSKEWNLVVRTEELRLIHKALGGRLKVEDVEPAKKLDADLARLRIKIIEQEAGEVAKLKENLEKG